MNLQKELKVAKEVAQEAGAKVLEIYNRNYEVYKKNNSLVTEADLASEKIILSALEKFGYKILSEETKDNFSRLGKEKAWIVDPLDGTKDFLDKTGEFSIMIALAFKGEPVLGVVYQPSTKKLYYAQKGKGSYLKKGNNLKKLKVSEVSNFFNARIIHSRSHLSKKTKQFIDKNNIESMAMGSTGLKIGLIAEGKADFYVSTNTYQWDTCAPEVILKEAGGKVTDLNNNSFNYNRREVVNKNGVVASNKKIHSQIIDNFN